MLNLDFLEKGLGIVSPPHFVYDFSGKMFLMLYSIKRSNFIVSLPLLLEILGNLCIAIVYFPAFDVINFEINPIFQMKQLYCMTKKSRQHFIACVRYFLSNLYFSPNDGPSKTMKNVFYFI